MTTGQIGILIILAITVGMFLWGKWRHDMVAVGSLLAALAYTSPRSSRSS